MSCKGFIPAADVLVFVDARLRLLRAKDAAHELLFIGNGGSAAIASHMAIDFMNKGEFSTRCFNDAAALTCIGNDYGYEASFAKQIEGAHVGMGDVLIAVSSSGESENIVQGIRAARLKDCDVITLTGFSPTNRVRQMGSHNFHVPSSSYGFVETTHLGILHALLEEVS